MGIDYRKKTCDYPTVIQYFSSFAELGEVSSLINNDIQPLNNITMSERSKVNRKERELKQEKQANRVVAWLAVILVALGVLTIIIASNS